MYLSIISAEPGNEKTKLQSQHDDIGGRKDRRLDFCRTLVSSLCSSPKRDCWTCEQQTMSVT